MGRPKPAQGPIGFMPSDGKFLGSRDLRGIPPTSDGTRMPIRVVEVVEYPPGEEICGKKNPKPFLAMIFERPPDEWLLAPADAKPKARGWVASRKEWKLGPECVMRLALRLGDDVTRWPGAIIPLRLEITTFGREDVYCVRPVPLAWEEDPQKRREAMKAIAAGTYKPPGLAHRDVKPAPPPERQPGEDDERIDDVTTDTTEPPDDWTPGT